MLLEILSTLIFLFSLWFILNRSESKTRPPGPWRAPILGTMVFMRTQKLQQPHQLLKTLCTKYGSIMTLKLGSLWQTIVDDPATVKEIFTSDVYQERAENPFILERSWGKPLGLLWGNGEGYKEIRRFASRTLRDFGFGKKSQDDLIQEEINELMGRLNTEIEKNKGVIEITYLFNVSIFNIVWSLLSGVKFSYDDEKLQALLLRLSELTKTISGSGNVLMGFPSIRRILSILPGPGQTRIDVVKNFQKEIKGLLDERRQQGYYKEEPRDFIDIFLHEIEKVPQDKSYAFSEKQLMTTILDFLIAGVDTTAIGIEFALLYLILNPEIQRKAQMEIDTVIGRNRLPSSSDRSRLPYMEAVYLETMRIANITPMVVRAPSKDVTLKCYKLTRGSFIVLNTYSVHMNEDIWTNPNTFTPERFLDSNGTKIKANIEHLYPFGAGRRSCLGEPLVKSSMFIFVTTLLQNYNFSIVPNHPMKPTAENPRFGFTLSPQRFVALVTPRT